MGNKAKSPVARLFIDLKGTRYSKNIFLPFAIYIPF